MNISLNPYLGFAGRAREAFTFYQSVLGGELDVTTYADGGQEAVHPEYLMHASLYTDVGLRLMGADIHDEVRPGHAVTINGDEQAGDLLQQYWTGLSEGATVDFPLGPAPWGGSFGQLQDRFGITWMVAYGENWAEQD